MTRRWLAAVVGSVLVIAMVGPGEAKPRPTGGGDDAAACMRDSGNDSGWDGPIAWCCYDDGCWVCNVDQKTGEIDDCVWDPSYRSSLLRHLPQDSLTVSPGDRRPVRPRMPGVQVPGRVLSPRQ